MRWLYAVTIPSVLHDTTFVRFLKIGVVPFHSYRTTLIPSLFIFLAVSADSSPGSTRILLRIALLQNSMQHHLAHRRYKLVCVDPSSPRTNGRCWPYRLRGRDLSWRSWSAQPQRFQFGAERVDDRSVITLLFQSRGQSVFCFRPFKFRAEGEVGVLLHDWRSVFDLWH